MANTYCENKSNKPVITKYDPSKNYVVQMVESLASIDYPNENHIYVIESTGEKYIYYNGAFSKFTSTPLEPLIVGLTATYKSSYRTAYQYYYSDNVVFDKTYDEVVEAVNQGRPVYLQPAKASLLYFDITVSQYNVTFSSGSATRNSDNTQHTIQNQVFVLPSGSTTGTATRVDIEAHSLVPDTALSSTSTRPVQNRVIKQAIDAISALSNPLMVTVTASNVTSTGHQYYTVWSSSNVTFSKTYTEIYNALRNGVPMVVTYDGLTKECIALQIDSSTIELSVYDAFLDTVPKPIYRTETFTIKSDNTGSYVKTLLSMNGLDILIGNQ